mgnify:CR=1 FL=1
MVLEMRWSIEDRPAYSLLKVQLEPGESIVSEAGAMLLYKGNVQIETSTGGILRSILRGMFAGEHIFLNKYTARSKAEVWLAPNLPGDIAYIETRGEPWVIQDMCYLAHHGSINLSVAWRGFKGVLAQGELIWLKAQGVGGIWVNAYGGIEKVTLQPGETAIIDNMHFVAMRGDVRYTIRKFGGWKSFLLGGEGLVVEAIGPAEIYVQTRILLPLVRILEKYLRR